MAPTKRWNSIQRPHTQSNHPLFVLTRLVITQSVNMPNEQQLKLALAKMLPEKICLGQGAAVGETLFYWHNSETEYRGPEQDEVLPQIRDTELLHVCWLVEETLDKDQARDYTYLISNFDEAKVAADWYPWHTPWQRRAEALAKVKGINLVERQ